jgi:hypothetical protein
VTADQGEVGFVLVASPFTGPFAWSKVAPLLRARNLRVDVHGVDAEIEGPVVLVAHSGGGPKLPALAATRAHVIGMVLLDALLPHPGRSWAQTVPEKFAAQLKAGAIDGKLAPWPQWWGDERMRALIPDDELRAAFVRACPAVSVEVIDAVMPHVPDPAAVFVQLSDIYAPESTAARDRGWPVLVLDTNHLAVLTQPVEVTDALLRAVELLPSEGSDA